MRMGVASRASRSTAPQELRWQKIFSPPIYCYDDNRIYYHRIRILELLPWLLGVAARSAKVRAYRAKQQEMFEAV